MTQGGRARSEAAFEFASVVGTVDPVHVVGHSTHADFGGSPDPASRAVQAPVGVVEFLPEEMIVRVGAGTLVTELDEALGEHGQMVALPSGGTVGGALAVGRSGYFQLGYGLVRDTLLEAQYVTPTGTLLQAGAPVVKNVSGFDLCRLLVGSLGTLGLLAEVVLRTRPTPSRSQWLAGPIPPAELARMVTRPSSIVSSADTTFVCIEGAEGDVERLSQMLQSMGLARVPGPPTPGSTRQRTTRLGQEHLNLQSGELGLSMTGTVLLGPSDASVDDRPVVPPSIAEINQTLRLSYDPTLRFNRGRQPWRVGDQGAV